MLSYLTLRPRRGALAATQPGLASGDTPSALEEAALEVALAESAAVEAAADGPAAGRDRSPGARAGIRGPRPAERH